MVEKRPTGSLSLRVPLVLVLVIWIGSVLFLAAHILSPDKAWATVTPTTGVSWASEEPTSSPDPTTPSTAPSSPDTPPTSTPSDSAPPTTASPSSSPSASPSASSASPEHSQSASASATPSETTPTQQEGRRQSHQRQVLPEWTPWVAPSRTPSAASDGTVPSTQAQPVEQQWSSVAPPSAMGQTLTLIGAGLFLLASIGMLVVYRLQRHW
mgnify:CR=1 FL=1